MCVDKHHHDINQNVQYLGTSYVVYVHTSADYKETLYLMLWSEKACSHWKLNRAPVLSDQSLKLCVTEAFMKYIIPPDVQYMYKHFDIHVAGGMLPGSQVQFWISDQSTSSSS